MFIQKLKGKLKRGIRIPLLNLRLRIERDDSIRHAVAHRVLLNHIRKLMEIFPELKDFDDPCIEQSRDYCQDFMNFADDYISLLHPPAIDVQKRRLLYRLRRLIKEPGFREKIDRLLLVSNIKSGLADDRAWALLAELEKSAPDQESQAFATSLRQALQTHEKYYEAKVPYFQFMDSILDQIYAHREQSLLFFFQNNRELIRNKRIYHFAPEQRLANWFRQVRGELGIDYTTVDPFLKSVDRREDLTELSFAGQSADLALCHHIFDLILDDRKAMHEVFRVLRPGGMLQVSGPESMQNESVNDWLIHDLSMHGYIRQYGRDFAQHLSSVGFEVSVDRTFLDMTREEHLKHGTMPIRIYNCRKPR